MVSNSNLSLSDEVHFQDLFFFVIYHILVLFFAEVSWLKAKSDIIEEFAFFVFLWVEEEAEVVKHIIE